MNCCIFSNFVYRKPQFSKNLSLKGDITKSKLCELAPLLKCYCKNLDLLLPKPKYTFRHLKKGIKEFHRRFVLAPADKAASNVVVV